MKRVFFIAIYSFIFSLSFKELGLRTDDSDASEAEGVRRRAVRDEFDVADDDEDEVEELIQRQQQQENQNGGDQQSSLLLAAAPPRLSPNHLEHPLHRLGSASPISPSPQLHSQGDNHQFYVPPLTPTGHSFRLPATPISSARRSRNARVSVTLKDVGGGESPQLNRQDSMRKASFQRLLSELETQQSAAEDDVGRGGGSYAGKVSPNSAVDGAGGGGGGGGGINGGTSVLKSPFRSRLQSGQRRQSSANGKQSQQVTPQQALFGRPEFSAKFRATCLRRFISVVCFLIP